MNTLINDIFNATDTSKQLLRDYRLNKISHAYMIIGDNGSGKHTLIKAFAQLVMCEDPHGTSPCGECSSCRYFDSFGEHPNMTVVSVKNKATIGVADIREMSEGVFVAPYIGNKKIYIIDNADKMTQQAQNALLKILEEPPEYVIFFLLVANRYAMLTTVMSRCRVLNMAPYSKESLLTILKAKQSDISDKEADILIHRSQGLPGKLISLIECDESYRNLIIDTVKALLDNDMEKIFVIAEQIDSRESALSFVNALNEIMRDAAVYMLCNDDKIVFNSDKIDLFENIMQKATLKRIIHFLSESAETIKMLSGNVTYQLCVKNLLMKW